MNKTVTINISGIIFHIEEEAYEKLSKYLSTIKGYFSKTEGGNEIMTDIESRIAEMLQAKTSAVKQVVLMSDVDAIIEVMGKPEEFAETSEPVSEEENNTNNADDYIDEEPIRKRFFRDMDNKSIGGVCSGIAAYFDVDVVWIRLLMVLLTFFAGMSIWVYIILWIVIPEAKTTAEKLSMRGERIDINNISRTVKEEAEQFKKRVEKYGNDVKNRAKEMGPDTRNFFEKMMDVFKEIIILFTKFFARLVGLALLIFGVMFMLGLMASVFGFSMIGVNSEVNDWVNLFFMERSHYTLSILGVLLFFGIPFIMMIYGGIKLLFKIHYRNRWLNLSAGIVWFFGLLIMVYVGVKTGKDFGEVGRVREQVNLQTKSDTLYLKANSVQQLLTKLNLKEEDFFDDDDDDFSHQWKHQRGYIVTKNDQYKFIIGYATLNIVPSTMDHFEIYVVRKARGEDRRAAIERAKRIHYGITQQQNVISFDEIFTVDAREKFRVQEIQILVKVPEGKVIHLDKSLEYFINDVENVTNTYDGDMVNRRWKMTKEGLACVDCDGISFEEHIQKKSDENKEEKNGVSIDVNGVKINTKNSKVDVDSNGINIRTNKSKIKIDETGIHVK